MFNRLPRRFRRRKFNTRAGFNSYFEERKTCEYLMNLIHSRFLSSETEGLFNFAITAIGEKTIFNIIKRKYPKLFATKDIKRRIKDKDLDEGDIILSPFKGMVRKLDSECLNEIIQPKDMKNLLVKDIADLLSKRLAKLSSCHEHEIETRFSTLQKTFSLTNEELEIVSFYYLKEICPLINNFFGDDVTTEDGIIDFSVVSVFSNYGDALLGLERASFLDAVAKGNLFKAEVIIRENHVNSIQISSWCADYLAGLRNVDLASEFFTMNNDEALLVSDFDVSEDNLMVLDTLFKNRSRQNILFYGATGTGKSSFARSLAKHCGKELLAVKIPEADEHKDRLSAIFATVNIADKNNSVILVDEADEVLNSCKSFFFESKTNKSWINQFLESHEKKVIWITNRSGEIDPSTMRRFSFSMEFKKVNRKNRLKVLKYEIRKKGIRDYFSEEELNEICRTYNVDAGGIVNAISALQITGEIDKDNALKKIRTILKNHEKATGGNRSGVHKEREFDSYTIDGLNTSHNLTDVVSAMQGLENRSGVKNMSIALLLYGMPGTGKSEFIYYLGNVLGKEVLLKRASDIQSMWVGETEKSIADAFAEAQETNSILFFDEADTFLFPRKSAHHSWEISFTNELLTQMESYKGIVAFATNDMEGLDHAAIRRFKFKIEFKPLTPEGNLHFYNSLLKGLLPDRSLSNAEITSLKHIKNLTPGDFAVVKDQISFMEVSAITHKIMIEALANEVRYKKAVKRIGF